MARIYLSFSQPDREFAQRITTSLEAAGHTLVETPVEPATNWSAAAARAIASADVLLALISPNAVGSRVIDHEIEVARAEGRPIIPILLQDTTLPGAIAQFQVLDARGDWDEFLTRLTRSIDTVADLEPVRPPRRQNWTVPIILTVLILVVISFLLLGLNLNLGAPLASNAANGSTGVAVLSLNKTLTGVSLTIIAAQLLSTAVPMTATPAPTTGPLAQPTDLGQAIGATVIAMWATDQDRIAATAFREAADLAIRTSSTPDRAGPALVLSILALLLAGGSALVLVLSAIRTRGGRSILSPIARRSPDAPTTGGQPAALLETYEVFISSSDIDKRWVAGLTKDLEELGYLVWWYAKDAPGLSFGQMIKSAIFYTKIFVVVISPDSMRSKHVEEEIRWADNFGRPLIPVLFRATPITDRLYGMAKEADIDFTHPEDYKASLEFLCQAISHYLAQRVQDLQGDANPPQ